MLETEMTRQKTLATIFLTAICGLTAWSQGAPTGCDSYPSKNDHDPRARTQVTWAWDADGKRVAVPSSVKEMKVARVIFVGDAALPLPVQDEIAQSLREHDYNDTKQGLDELLERVRDAWQHRGYFTVKVGPSDSQTLHEDSESRTVAITVNVAAGKQYRLEEIDFGNPTGGPPRLPNPLVPDDQRATDEQLRAFFPHHQGDIFDTHKIQKGLEELRKAYGAYGFINFTVVPSTKIDDASGLITLFLDIEEGKQFRIGNVEVIGMDSEVFRKLLLDSGLVRGRIFNASAFESIGVLGAEVNVERRIHQDDSTIDLLFRIRSCDAP
jgi:outer membrane protein assembly factor BamA